MMSSPRRGLSNPETRALGGRLSGQGALGFQQASKQASKRSSSFSAKRPEGLTRPLNPKEKEEACPGAKPGRERGGPGEHCRVQT